MTIAKSHSDDSVVPTNPGIRELGPPADWSKVGALRPELAAAVDLHRKTELFAALPDHARDSESQFESGMLSALDRMRNMGPRDAVEDMFVAQMTAVHAHAMDCLNRATSAAPSQPRLHGAYIDQSTKLLGLFLKQMSALDRRRGRGEQKVTVEHVHVNAGGNAIVGHVESSTTACSHSPPTVSHTNQPDGRGPSVVSSQLNASS